MRAIFIKSRAERGQRAAYEGKITARVPVIQPVVAGFCYSRLYGTI
jgi:hypothetical protein